MCMLYGMMRMLYTQSNSCKHVFFTFGCRICCAVHGVCMLAWPNINTLPYSKKITDLSWAMWKHATYHDIHGIYRYIPCMNRVSTNPKCAYSFFKSDANTMSSACEQYAWMYKHWKITLKCKTSLHVYTCICIVYRDMHYLKHAYTCICMVYRIPAGGQDSRCCKRCDMMTSNSKIAKFR